METPAQHAYDLFRDSLNEALATVRSYDAKAQIVGVGFIFALGIVGQMIDALQGPRKLGVVDVMVAWGIVILPILFPFELLKVSRLRELKRQRFFCVLLRSVE